MATVLELPRMWTPSRLRHLQMPAILSLRLLLGAREQTCRRLRLTSIWTVV